jgi:hypothetical protein
MPLSANGCWRIYPPNAEIAAIIKILLETFLLPSYKVCANT